MKIVISGYYGSKNAGDEAMLDAMLEVLHEIDPNISITVISVNPENTRKRHNVEAIAWLDIFSIVRKIFSADLLISGGGSLLQNVTSRRSLYYCLGIIFLAEFFCKPVMLYAQGIGPICGNFAKRLTNLIVNRVKLITVRDHGSLEELRQLKITRPKIFCTADPVLAIKATTLDVGRKILHNYNEDQFIDDEQTPLIGLAVRRWHGFDHFQNELAKAIDQIVEKFNARIIFLPMQASEDVKAAKAVAEITNVDCTILNDEYITSDLLSLVGCMDILISIRLHALIFAGVMNVPMIGISYDPKIDRFLDSIGENPIGDLENITAEKIFKAVEKILQNKNSKSRDSELLKNLHDKARLNAELAIDLIRRS